MIPQIIYLVLTVIFVGLYFNNKEITRKYNIVSYLIAVSLLQGLYYWGGFYDQFEIPQLIMMVYTLVNIGTYARFHGKTITDTPTVYSLILTILVIIVLFFGHFFDPLLKVFNI